MLRCLADENFDGDLFRALMRGQADLDILRVQDVGLAGIEDPEVLNWAASNGRVLLTHDVTTMTYHAYERVREKLPMPGVIEVSLSAPLPEVIEDLLLLINLSTTGEWEGQVLYVPLR